MEDYSVGGTYAVFMDFISLYQKGLAGQDRSCFENKLFQKALRSLSTWYAHANPIVFRITTLPAGYPQWLHFSTGKQPEHRHLRRPWARCGRSWSGSKRGERKTVGEYKRPNVKQCSYMEAREEGMAAELLGEARVVQAYS